jgi:hypothetical protein
MWIMRIIVFLILLAGQSVVIDGSQNSYGTMEVVPNKITSVGLDGEELWYACSKGGIFSTKPGQNSIQYSDGSYATMLAVSKNGTKAFGGRESLTISSQDNLPGECRIKGTVTTLDVTPDDKYIFTAQAANLGQASYSVFNVDSGDLVAEFNAGNISPARLCASRKLCKSYVPPSEDVKDDDEHDQESYEFVTVRDKNIVRLVTFDGKHLKSGELFHQTPGGINDIAGGYDSTFYMACEGGLLLKSFEKNKEQIFFPGQKLCSVKVIDDKDIIVGTKDGKVHIIISTDYDHSVKTVQITGLPMHHIACDLSDEDDPKVAFIVDKNANDGTTTELLGDTNMQVIRMTFDELKSAPEWKETLSCKQRGIRVLGGSICLVGIGVVLYWLTYCSHQKQGTFC